MSREIMVYISLGGKDILVGRLLIYQNGYKESASFEYDKEWLGHPERFAIDPSLQMIEGTFHTDAGMSLFGALGDSAPDRWGRLLMRRFEVMQSKEQKRSARTLLESDYLLGVHDEVRQGALRFALSTDKNRFLSIHEKITIPPFIDLVKLLSAADKVVNDRANFDDIELLLAPGSSLGGARPKAVIRDLDGTLAIAKFAKSDDEFNIVAWEAVALTLAKYAAIKVPPYRLEKIGGKNVLIIKRFDRDQNRRIPFLSAMSMLSA